MAIDTTRTLRLSPEPIEIVATLGLTMGEYRIENQQLPGEPGSIIHFIAAASLPDQFADEPPENWAGHSLASGAREDIGIETGQKWYFWAPNDNSSLVITRSEAGGAIGGSPPVIRFPSFHIDIFRVYDSAADIPTEAPAGGTYNLDTSQLTPPTGWSESQTRLTGNQVEATSRAIIDPNTQDRLITPIWNAPRRVDLIGTITGIVTSPPLTGGAAAGSVTLGVQTRGITNDEIATDAINLRTLDGGAAGTYIGFDSTGAAAEITPRARIEQFDVPAYSGATEGQVLTVESGVPAWTDKTPPAPRDIEFFYGHVVPSPDGHNDIWFVDENASGLSGIVESDRTTARTRIFTGDIYEYDSTAGALGTGAWVFAANQAVEYAEASETRAGLMSPADKTKLDSVERGAEVNVNADWDAAEGDAEILNKPHIPVDPVNADWNATVGLAAIRNKPDSITDFDVPDYSMESDNRVLGLSSSALAWIDTGVLRINIGPTFPSNPAEGNHQFFSTNVTGLSDYFEADGATARTMARRGEIGLYRGGKWIHQGTVNTEYPEATAITGGVLTDAQAVKLHGIEAGAEVNEPSDWDATSGSARILNKPTIPTVPGNATTSTAGLMSSADKTKLEGIAAGAEVNVNADWHERDSDSDTFIRNKPSIPTLPNNPLATTRDVRYDLDVTAAGVVSWQEVEVPDIDTLSVGASLPTENVALGNWHIQTANQTSMVPADVREADGTTVRTQLIKGDVYRRDEEQGSEVWTLEGNIDTTYTVAAANAVGLMSAADKTKLDGIAANAEVNVNADWSETDSDADSYIENKPTTLADFDAPAYTGNDGRVLGLTGGSLAWVTEPDPEVPALTFGGTLPASPDEDDQHVMTAAVTSNVPSNVRQTDGTTAATALAVGDAFKYDGTNWILQGNVDTDYQPATARTPGLMAAADKSKLDGIETGAEVNIQADWAENNSAVDAYIQNKPTIPAAQIQSDWAQTDSAAVDFIDNKPTIPAAQVNADWNADSGAAEILNKPSFISTETQSDWAQTGTNEASFIRNKPDSIADFDVPAFGANQNGQLLGVRGGSLVWRDEDNPRVPTTHVTNAVPSNPGLEDIWIVTEDITSGIPANVHDQSAVTRTRIDKGDIYRYSGTNWDLLGSTNTEYDAATGMAAGLMTAADKLKLDGIESGAEENVKIDWNADSGDAEILNKPDVPTLPSAPSAAAQDLQYNLQVTTDGSATWEQDTGGGAGGGEANVQSDWDEGDTGSDAFIRNKPDIQPLPGLPTDDDNYVLQRAGGEFAWHETELFTTGEQTKLSGIASGAEVNVQADWNETDSGADAFIRNRPGIPTLPTVAANYVLRRTGSDWTWESTNIFSGAEHTKLAGIQSGAQVNPSDEQIGDAAFSNPPDDLTDAEKTAVRNAIGSGSGGGVSTFTGLSDTPAALGTAGQILQVNSAADALEFTAAPSGGGSGEQNVQSDWNETDTADDAFILNKPDLAGRFIGDHSARTAYDKGDVVFSTGQFWRAKQNVPDSRTGAPTNDLDYWQQATFSIGIVSSLPNFADNDEFDLNRDRWVILTAAERLSGTRDGSGSSPYVADVQDTRSISDVRNNQITDLNRGDILRVDTWPTRYWARMVNAAGSAGEQNVQANWTETDTASDAFILNKPTIPTLPGNATDTTAGLMSGLDKAKLDGIAANAERNVQADWNVTNTTNDSYIQNKPTIPTIPTDAQIGDRAFSNPPTDLTTTEQEAVRTAIGAGTSSVTTVAGFGTEEVASLTLDSTGGYNWIATTSVEIPADDWWLINLGYSADGRWITIRTADLRAVTASSGAGASASGEYVEINGPGGRMRLGRDSSNMLRIATQRNVDDPSPLRILRVLPNTGSNTVITDATITGDGGTATPLSVANPFTAADETKLDGIAAGAEVNVQSDWNATTGDAFIQNKPTIPNVPSAPSSAPDQRDYNLRVATDGTASWEQDTGGGGGGEQNVQADWTETDTASDAFILNKPTIPTLRTDAQIGDAAFSNSPTDLTDTEKGDVRRNIDLNDSQIGVLAFRNPPGNLTTTQQTAVRTAIGAGTGGGGGGASSFTGLTDTPAALGTAGQLLQVNMDADALEFVAPTGNGITRTLRATSSALPTATVQTAPALGTEITGYTWTLAPGAHDAGWRQQDNATMFADSGGNEVLQLGVDIELVVDGTVVDRGFVTEAADSDLPLRTVVTGAMATGVQARVRPDIDVVGLLFSRSGRRAIYAAGLAAPIQANAILRVYEVAITLFGGTGGGGGGSSTFTGLTDTPASLGTAGQFIRVNSAGTALEFTAAPMGGGSSRYLPSPDERTTENGFLFMGWEDDFSNGWGIRRVSLTTGAAETASEQGNVIYTTLNAAWPQRANLDYT